MRNKFLKGLSGGICCIMFSILLSTCLPQNNKIAAAAVLTHETSIGRSQNIDPPYP